MRPVARLVEFEHRAPADNFFAEFDERRNNVLKVHHHRPPVIDCQHIHAETGLQLRIFIELVQYHVGLKFLLDFNNHAHALAVGFVADIRNAFDFLFLHQFGDFLHQHRLVDLVRDFVHHNRLTVLADFLNRALRPHHNRAAPGQVRIFRPAVAQNQPAGREVRPRHDADKVFNRNVRIVHIRRARVQNFAQIMRRNVGRHTDRNAVRAVDQKVRKPRRQHRRFL